MFSAETRPISLNGILLTIGIPRLVRETHPQSTCDLWIEFFSRKNLHKIS